MTSASTLIFDADDTLWENNLRFNQTFSAFLEWSKEAGHPEQQVREIFAEVERRNTQVHGYGTAVFTRSLQDTFADLQRRSPTPTEVSRLDALVANLVSNTVQPLPGVIFTLQELSSRHEMILLTKGLHAEQKAKIESSGLAGYFETIMIVAEKDVKTYSALLVQHWLDASKTWMIGNSPKSDINPARAAGLNAVYIPNPHTWALEHDVLDPTDDNVLCLGSLTELLAHF
jgi:putative hydrolase of the HAD superfamily